MKGFQYLTMHWVKTKTMGPPIIEWRVKGRKVRHLFLPPPSRRFSPDKEDAAFEINEFNPTRNTRQAVVELNHDYLLKGENRIIHVTL